MAKAINDLLHPEKMSIRKERIFNFLNSHTIGILSTVDPNNQPHGVVIYYAVDNDFYIYFITRRMTKKYQNLLYNNKVMLTVYDESSLTTLQLEGFAHEVEEGIDINMVADRLYKKTKMSAYGKTMPIAKLDEGPYVAFSIKPVNIRMAIYGDSRGGDYNDIFETIESFDFEP